MPANFYAGQQDYIAQLNQLSSEVSTALDGADTAVAAAAASATSAQTSATNAATSATNAQNSATDAQTSATNAGTSATAAAGSATAAAGSATAAAGSATSASTSAGQAATSATNANSSATAAATSATSADTSATAAASSAAAAAASYDSFDDRYLGPKASDPTTDNDGNALLDGALYWSTGSKVMKVYDLGTTSWKTTYAPDPGSAYAQKGANSDITSLTGLTGGVSTVDYVDFDTAATSSDVAGRVRWNDTDGTLEVVMKGGNVVQQIGQELPVRVVNKTGATLVNGKAVYITGAQGNRITVAYADNGTYAASRVFGVLTEDIADNQEGFVTTMGLVRNINTSAFAEGATVYLGTAGNLVTAAPAGPAQTIVIGNVARSHATIGTVLVDVQLSHTLDSLNDVTLTSPSNGQGLIYDAASGVWKNATTLKSEAAGSKPHNLIALSGVTASNPIADADAQTLSVEWIQNTSFTFTQGTYNGTFTPTNVYGTGTGLTVTSVVVNTTGSISSIVYGGSVSGYATGDVLALANGGWGGELVLIITDTSAGAKQHSNLVLNKGTALAATNTSNNVLVGSAAGLLAPAAYAGAVNNNVIIGSTAGVRCFHQSSVVIGAMALLGGGSLSGTAVLGSTVVGSEAASRSTQSVTAFGYQALKNLITGVNNTAFGRQAGRQVTTGSSNAFFGNGAGYSTTTGYGNCVAGDGAGYSITTGANNVLLGRRAGEQVTTGTGNIIIGYAAGGVTTGSNCIIIGNTAGAGNLQTAVLINSGPGNIVEYLGAGSPCIFGINTEVAEVRANPTTPLGIATKRYVDRRPIAKISTNTTAVAGTTYIFTASCILDLPGSPSPGDWIKFSNRSGTTTASIARNGQPIMGLAENLTLDSLQSRGELIYVDATEGWTLV